MKYFFHKKNNMRTGGYSMIELIIYLALFAAISVVLINSLVVVMRTYAQASTYRKLQSNGELAMERIVREIRQASSVTTGSSTLNANPGVLALTGTDSSNASHTVSINVANNAVQITDNGTSGNLTTSDVVVPVLIFRRFTTTAGTEGIKTELTVSTASGQTMSANFYATTMLRGK